MASSIDVDTLNEKYRIERDKRLSQANRSSIDPLRSGLFPEFDEDPWASEKIVRDPIVEDVDVVMTGAGLAAEVAAAKLLEAGITDFRMIDVAGDFGGVWYWQRYPGVRCDIESYIYMPLLEEVGFEPSEKYASGKEIRQLAAMIGRHYGLYEKAMFQTKILEARWDEQTSRWHVKTDRGDLIRARFLLGTSGFLHYPKFPDVPGIADFKGKLINPSRWDRDYTGGDSDGNLVGLKGKRVALLGTGASGIQIFPHLPQHADKVYLVQRTPAAVPARNNRPTDKTWFRSQKPGWQMERMRNWHDVVNGNAVDVDLVNDCVTERFAALNAAALSAETEEEAMACVQQADFAIQQATRDHTAQVVQDPETAEKLKAWYNFFCKRPLFADDYLQTFNEPNVELIDAPGGLESFTETGFYANGKHYEVDCFIMSSGYQIGAYDGKSATFPIIGRHGESLAQYWSEGVRSVHGVLVHGFPNFQIVGTLAQAGMTLNYMWQTTELAIHAAGLISKALNEGFETIEVTAEAEQRWKDTLLSLKHDDQQFFENCTPGFINNEGDTSRPGPYDQCYGGDILEFFDILRAWRDKGYREDTIVTAGGAA